MTATALRSRLLKPGFRGSRRTRALGKKGRPLEEAGQRLRNCAFGTGAPGAGAGVGVAAWSGRLRGALRERLFARAAARTSQVTRGSGVGARGDAVRGREEARGVLWSRGFCNPALTTSNAESRR